MMSEISSSSLVQHNKSFSWELLYDAENHSRRFGMQWNSRAPMSKCMTEF